MRRVNREIKVYIAEFANGKKIEVVDAFSRREAIEVINNSSFVDKNGMLVRIYLKEDNATAI